MGKGGGAVEPVWWHILLKAPHNTLSVNSFSFCEWHDHTIHWVTPLNSVYAFAFRNPLTECQVTSISVNVYDRKICN